MTSKMRGTLYIHKKNRYPLLFDDLALILFIFRGFCCCAHQIIDLQRRKIKISKKFYRLMSKIIDQRRGIMIMNTHKSQIPAFFCSITNSSSSSTWFCFAFKIEQGKNHVMVHALESTSSQKLSHESTCFQIKLINMAQFINCHISC